MNERFSRLVASLAALQTVSLLSRLFGWAKIRLALADAAATIAALQQEVTSAAAHATDTRTSLERQLQSSTTDLAIYRERTLNYEREMQALRDENLRLKKEEEFRAKRYSDEIVSLQSIKASLIEERAKEVAQRHEEELLRLQNLKETWSAHQTDVQRRLKSICQKHTVKYVDKVAFKGDPDNTLLICDEHVVFDAKSPAGDDLRNFPLYLKAQAEAAGKYAKQEGVKREVFLVVPSNTLASIKDFVYNLADYDVFIVTQDALEPLVLSLCRLEEYEFAEQLSPEDRDNICRVIGKFAHLSKRRIQIDAFFARQFIELAYKCENDLPGEILQKVLDYEKSEKLNPPMEKRAKAISLKTLDEEQARIEMEVETKGIQLANGNLSTSLNNLNLYR